MTFTKQFLTKTTIFRCFDVFSVRPPQIFQVQAKISTINTTYVSRPSSHDCGASNLDEYFHFYSIAGQKLKMNEIFEKKLNNFMP